MKVSNPPSRSLPRFLVGIDLGTTNCAAAYVDTDRGSGVVEIFPILQFVAPGQIDVRETLPSFHYIPAEGECASWRLPWQLDDPKYLVGVFARDHGASVPGRLIVSAKSWLSHSGVDRTAKLLPWHGATDVEKLSPMEASASYLAHIRSAWNHRWPEHLLEEQTVVITIPASFDEIARELTVSAAQRAGLPRIVLLEEPQAAFYAWINARGHDWQKHVQPGQSILVCDIGGGTTDFTLIQARPGEAGDVRFHRYAVGEHLILGGDNLDLALAHHVEKKLAGEGQLEPRQWSVLVRRCQHAKETLLASKAPEHFTLHLPGSGSKLIAGSLKVALTRSEVADLLVDGFVPFVGLEEKPAQRSSGFQEFGLPYASDHAITRYLAAFLTAHRHALEASPPAADHDPARPNAVLFNGGLFESAKMRKRILAVLESWFNERDGANRWRPVVLENERLHLAVAVGAAYYGLVRRGYGVRISGGLPRSYYIGVKRGHKPAALCLVPAGLEEGQEIELEQKFELLIRQPVEFPIFVSSSRTADRAGQFVSTGPTQLQALPPIRTVLRAGKKTEAAEAVLTRLHARLTEIGTLEVWCAEVEGARRWKLQFDVRAATQTDVVAHEGAGESAGLVDDSTLRACAGLIHQTFGTAKPPIPPENLVRQMEEATGLSRLDWPPALLRSIWEELLPFEPARARGVLHEARWLNLLGFALRPGYGVAVDDWRVGQTWSVFERKVAHSSNEMCRAEWWILWRRIAGGLVLGQQRVLAEPLMAQLRAQARAEAAKHATTHGKPPPRSDDKLGPHETQEVWRLLASLELLSPNLKIECGELLLAQVIRKGSGRRAGAALWALARVGSRVPMSGPLNTLVPTETVEHWIEELLRLEASPHEVSFTLMQLSRRTGDRYRDISETIRSRVLELLARAQSPPHFVKLVCEGGALGHEEQSLVFGESLPHGLQLASTK